MRVVPTDSNATDPNATQSEHSSEILPYLTPAQATSRAVKRLAPHIESAIVERKVALGIPLSKPEVKRVEQKVALGIPLATFEVKSLGTKAKNLRRVPSHSSDERIQTRKSEYYEWRPHLDPPEPRPRQYRAILQGPSGPIRFLTNRTLQKRHPLTAEDMDDYGSDTDSDYTTYWRDWVGSTFLVCSR